ncbi:MAG: hypothetical protein AAF517_17935, partial [Planctomycetota bacterium]
MRILWAVACVSVGLSWFSSLLHAQRAYSKEEIEKGTRVTLKAEQMLLKDLVKEIEKQTGNKIEAGRSRRFEAALSSEKVSLDVKDKPFWEVVGWLARRTETHVEAIGNGGVKLTDLSFPKGDVLSKWQTSGPFRWQASEHFYGYLQLEVLPEPWMGRGIDYSAWRARARLKGGKKIEGLAKPRRDLLPSMIQGAVSLTFPLGDGSRALDVERLDLDLRYAAPKTWVTLTTEKPVEKLCPQETKVGKKGVAKVLDVQELDDRGIVFVSVSVVGVPVTRRETRPVFSLVDREGDQIPGT